MSRRTRDALASVGFTADGHRSHQLTDEDMAAADLIMAMAGEHVAYVRRRHPDAAAKTASHQTAVPRPAPGPEPLAERVARLGPGRPAESKRGRTSRTRPAARTRSTWPAPTELAELCAELLPRLRLSAGRGRPSATRDGGVQGELRVAEGDVGAGLAHVLGDHAGPHQVARRRCTRGRCPKRRLEEGGRRPAGHHHPGGRGQAEAEPEDQGGGGEHHADGLGEPLGRAGHRLRAPQGSRGAPPGWPAGRAG